MENSIQHLLDKLPLESLLRVMAIEIDNLKVSETPTITFQKLHPDATDPEKAHDDDMCYDLTACEEPEFHETYVQYRTGLRFNIPEGYGIEMPPRSSVSSKDLILANSVGQIDTGYRGEVFVRFKFIPRAVLSIDHATEERVCHDLKGDMNFSTRMALYSKGDKICQIKLVKKVNSIMVEGVVDTNTKRGEGGYGSTGK